VQAFYPAPMLELEGWRQGRPLEALMCTDTWDQPDARNA
jgi:5,6-dimethylbenzimidazole synthase